MERSVIRGFSRATKLWCNNYFPSRNGCFFNFGIGHTIQNRLKEFREHLGLLGKFYSLSRRYSPISPRMGCRIFRLPQVLEQPDDILTNLSLFVESLDDL